MFSSRCGAFCRLIDRLPRHSLLKAAFASRRAPRNSQNSRHTRVQDAFRSSKRARNCFHFLPFLAANRDSSAGYQRLSGQFLFCPSSCRPLRCGPPPTGRKPRQAKRLRWNGTFGLLLQDGALRTNTEQSPPCQEIVGLFAGGRINADSAATRGRRPRAARFKSDDVRIKPEELRPVTMIESRHQAGPMPARSRRRRPARPQRLPLAACRT